MIRQSNEIDKISAALVAARQEMKAVGKSGHNSFDKYKYAKLEDYVNAVDDQLAKHGLMVVSGSGNAELLPERKNAKGNSEYVVRVSMAMRLLHSSGQWIECDAVGEGQDRSDKGIYKAHTGARKYGYASLFGLATTDDPERDDDGGGPPPRSQRDTPPAPAAQAPANARSQFADAVQKWTGVSKDDLGAACRDFIAHHGLSGNYTDDDLVRLTAIAKANDMAGHSFPGPSPKPAGSAPTTGKRSASIAG